MTSFESGLCSHTVRISDINNDELQDTMAWASTTRPTVTDTTYKQWHGGTQHNNNHTNSRCE